MAPLRPLVSLAVEEAYQLLQSLPGQSDIPPLEAIENEDWGRDYLLSRLADLPPDQLARLGYTAGGEGDTAELDGT